jgi:prophage tail gpP-like protein
MTAPETFTLTINGKRFERWEEIRVTREIDRMCTDFSMAVSERFLGAASDSPLAPFMPCTVSIGSDVVLTGYIDNYLPEVEADRHSVRITGRSKTEDLIDCTPDITGGQFAGYKLDAIAPFDRQPVRHRCRGGNRRRRAVPRRDDRTPRNRLRLPRAFMSPPFRPCHR